MATMRGVGSAPKSKVFSWKATNQQNRKKELGKQEKHPL
jgi:hypothetical protein